MASRSIYAIDVGAPGKGLAWARLEEDPDAIPSGGHDLHMVSKHIAADLQAGHFVAIGFEAPAFIPIPVELEHLRKQRSGESRGGVSRAWSAPAGLNVTQWGLQICPWLLRQVRTLVGEVAPSATLDPAKWSDGSRVLLWEAFVSGPGHARSQNAAGISEHVQDAATAAVAFRAWWGSNPRSTSAVTCEPRFSILGAAALWANWSQDLALLSAQPLVLWPEVMWSGDIAVDEPSWLPATTLTNPGVQCPVPGCPKQYSSSRSGWDPHIASVRKHPEWHPDITSPQERKRLFRSEFPEFFR